MSHWIYLSPPDMSDSERAALLRAFDSGWVAPVGPELEAFEEEFAEYVGARYAVALSSGTAALHLALRVLGVKTGQDVITSTLTFVATANAVKYLGANPVFIDSDENTWNLDPTLLEEELALRARSGNQAAAVVAVDVFGQCASYDQIIETCTRHQVPLVEDAAEALGARLHQEKAGRFGAIACFSFNGNKIITTSGGGMVVTDNKRWAEQIRFLSTQARENSTHYEHRTLGYNYRLSNLLAGIGRAQLERIEQMIDRRRKTFTAYHEALANLPGWQFMPEPRGYRSTRWLTCATIDPNLAHASRDRVIEVLNSEQIEARPVWKPMHLQPLYRTSPVRRGSVAEKLFNTGICLPSGSAMTEEERTKVIQTVQAVAGGK